MTIKSTEFFKNQVSLPDKTANFIEESRNSIRNILNKNDNRLIVVSGPCSIHNYEQAIEYAKSLKEMTLNCDNLLVLMRVYVEKPRTTIGWTGYIYDPNLDNTCDIELGIKLTRKLMLEINQIGLPVACEFLNVMLYDYYADLVSWGCIGARTTQSQIHRQMASDLNIPIGFKNGTTGSVKIAIDAILTIRYKHNMLKVNNKGCLEHCLSDGNQYGHVILRGGWDGTIQKPNYYDTDIQIVSQLMQYNNIERNIIVDCSHGNSFKNHKNQAKVVDYLAKLIAAGERNLVGLMLESNINEGNQKLTETLKYGVSITDACINLNETRDLLLHLNYVSGCRIKILN